MTRMLYLEEKGATNSSKSLTKNKFGRLIRRVYEKGCLSITKEKGVLCYSLAVFETNIRTSVTALLTARYEIAPRNPQS